MSKIKSYPQKAAGNKKRNGTEIMEEKSRKKCAKRARRIAAAIISSIMLLCFLVTGVSAEGGEHSYEGKKLCVGGFAFGVRFGTSGVFVVNVGGVISNEKEVTPALDAGVRPGDIIKKVNGEEINTAAEFSEAIAKSEGKAALVIDRNGSEITVTLTPAKEDVTGTYKAGIEIKDSMAGIGTVTYVDAESGAFGGLGHGICDPSTGILMPLKKGSAMQVEIGGVVKGKCGKPGEIKGYFLSERTGNVVSNTLCGVFGYFSTLPTLSDPIPIGTRNDIKEGKAVIRCTLGSDGVKEYEIELSRIDRDGTDNKNFVITVTDKALIERTGGIIQGMSGSPIIQDGKLVGAVTHVLVNDPTRGYGILIENMLDQAGK